MINSIDKQKSGFYKPSLIAKFARLIIPLLYRFLPYSIYRYTYNFLYFVYRSVYRYSYLVVLLNSIFKDKVSRKKALLTWKLLPYTLGGCKSLENAFDMVQIVEKNNIPGAFVECGVAQGGTAAMLACAQDEKSSNTRDKWFFDSYQGLPEPTKEDYINGKTGSFIRPLPRGSCLGTIEQVSELMYDTLKMSPNNVKLIKGWFQNTICAYKDKIKEIAILRLDGDWYESTKIPLENLYDQISLGGIVIIDDYGTCFGSKKATDEFIKYKNLKVNLLPDGRGGIYFFKP